MDAYTLLSHEKHEIRGNSNLMLFFMELYKQHFGRNSTCIPCNFDNDYRRLRYIYFNNNKKKYKKMSYKLKEIKVEILTFEKDGNKIRCYDNNLNDEFVRGFLTYGTDAELKERRKLFAVLPKLEETQTEEEQETSKTIKKRK